jgi:hypothetical protein
VKKRLNNTLALRPRTPNTIGPCSQSSATIDLQRIGLSPLRHKLHDLYSVNITMLTSPKTLPDMLHFSTKSHITSTKGDNRSHKLITEERSST